MANIHLGNYSYNKFKDKNQFTFDAYCYYGNTFVWPIILFWGI